MRNEKTSAKKGLPFRKAVALTMTLTLLLGITTYSCPSADAWWIFGKKKDKQEKERKRKKREVKASSVGLVPGNPPALYWKPADKTKACVLALHELGLYGGVFDDLGTRMSAKGVAVYAIDLRGFGGWRDVEGKEGKMDLKKTLEDVKGSVEIIKKLNGDTPVFILGEAMGGALALQAAAEFPELINGVISAAPGGEHYGTVNNYVTVASSLAIGAKKAFGLGDELLDLATPKQDLRDAFRDDEMVRMDLTPKELLACQFFMYKTKKMAKTIKSLPVLVVHGGKDGESKEEGSSDVYETLATKDKQYLKVDDGDHYTFEDVKVNDKAFDTTLTWLNERLSPTSAASTGSDTEPKTEKD